VKEPDWTGPLAEAHRLAIAYLAGLPDRAVGSDTSAAELRKALGGPLPETPSDPREVIASLASAAEPGLVATPSGRFFGFVIGGATPAALAADWLTSAWDQNACLSMLAPAAAAVEDVAGEWLRELLGLPAHASVSFVTGGQMANVTCLAAARNWVLRSAGWDVEADGLIGAPPLRVLAGADRHGTIDRALRYLGLGTRCVVPIATDGQGRMRPEALRAALRAPAGAGFAEAKPANQALSGPVIVCAQVGEVNTGAADPIGAVCDAAHEAGAWVHVDGAFGLWAAVSPRLRRQLDGIERADSWATDAHKWLNVPYDSGLAFTAHPEAHRAAMSMRASYLTHGDERDPMDYTPESSRRARAFGVYAAIRALGRTGITDLVERCCALAERFAGRFTAEPGVEVLNDVVLNQVLVRFGDDDGLTRDVVRQVQAEGTCWASGTTWRGRAAMRISVSNWSTDEDDVDRSVEAILTTFARARAR
jgi:glutamate/tyrosine decarboxylase-like PLP-dependent enzyme